MDILITGASIAGPALAGLLVDQGHSVTVVERAPALRTGGYAVDVRGAALEVLTRLHLRDALRPLETDTERNVIVDGSGRKLAEMPRGFGVIEAGDVEVRRGDLSALLVERSRGATYRFGTTIVALDADAGDVELSDGTRARYDLVVCSDGVRSRTRELAGISVTVDDLCARADGTVLGVAVWSAPNAQRLHREQQLYFEPGLVASIKSQRGDERVDVVLFYAAHRAQLAADRVAALAHWPFPMLTEAPFGDLYYDVISQVRAASYHRGRVALLGDAAWCPTPLSGQGTSLALVGACALAVTLDADVPASLARYDALMRPFVQRNLDVAKGIANDVMPKSRSRAWARVQGMRLVARLPGAARIMQWAMRDIAKAARGIELPQSRARSSHASTTPPTSAVA